MAAEALSRSASDADAVFVRVLGPVAVEVGGRRAALGPQQKALLAALVLAQGRAVSRDQLVDMLWEGAKPAHPIATVRTQVLNLRRVLEPARRAASGFHVLVSTGDRTQPSYALRLADDQLDANRFVRLTQEARTALARGAAGDALTLLERALALWHGPPLAGVDTYGFAAAEAARLAELRLVAREDRLDTLLALGRHTDAAGELTGLVREHRLRERLWAQLILALYQSGRQADALAAYQEVRRVLDEELGVQPGQALSQLQQRILRADPGLEHAPEPAPLPERFVPRQLPSDIGSFTGRVVPLRRLDSLLADRDANPPQTLVVSSVTGTAGVGKTTLAVHWLHRVADRFPDGQLYVNLRGYASAMPVTADEALGQLLQGLGVEPGRMPEDPDAKGALYRSLLAGKKVLVLLDNAAELDQVRPLLPGSPTCLVVVTSRNDLRGLTAFLDAQRIHLDVFSPQESLDLLARTLGQPVHDDPDAAAELARLCGQLPLALRVCAANLIGGRSQHIVEMNQRLSRGDRLAQLGIASECPQGVQGAFDLSYSVLSPDERRLFRLLGLVPGADVTAAAVAALLGVEDAEAKRLLDQLCARCLVEPHRPDRFRLHDLLRLYARERARRESSAAECEAALRRLFCWYLLTLTGAARQLYRHFYSGPGPGPGIPAEPLVRPLAFPDKQSGWNWLEDEWSNLLAAVEHTAQQGPYAFSWLATDALHGHLRRIGRREDWLRAAHRGLRAAERARHLGGQATMHWNLGYASWGVADLPRALHHSERAVALYGRIGTEAGTSPTGYCGAQAVLGAASRGLGRLVPAEHHLRQALRLAQQHRQPSATLSALVCLGHVHVDQGRFAEARESFTTVRTLTAEWRMDSFYAAGLALCGLGAVARHLGRPEEAWCHLAEAARLSEGKPRFLDFYHEITLCELACLYRDTGRHEVALSHINEALCIIERSKRRPYETDALNIRGTVHCRLGKASTALEDHRRALDLALGNGCRREEAVARIGMAAAHRALDAHQEVRAHAEAGLLLATEGGFRVLEGDALTELALTYLALAEPARARSCAEGALTVHRGTGYLLGSARALEALARAHAAEHRPRAAQRYQEEARRLQAATGVDRAAPPPPQG